MSNQVYNASGYSGSGSSLVLSPKVSLNVMTEYRTKSPLGVMANWDGDPMGDLVQHSKIYYETTQGLTADDVCDDRNGQVTHLHQSFVTDYMELCGEAKYTLKKDEAEAIRMSDRWAIHQSYLPEDLEHWLNKKTIPFALGKLLASAHPLSKGLGAIGIPVTSGVAAGLGDVNNPIKVDISTARSLNGSTAQSGAINMQALISRLTANMFDQSVLASTSSLMVTGGSGLMTGFSMDKMCKDECRLNDTGIQYKVTPWMYSVIRNDGVKVDYIVMHDPKKFWFQMHQLYLKWVPGEHYQALTGDTLWGAKVANPKAVSVAAVQFV